MVYTKEFLKTKRGKRLPATIKAQLKNIKRIDKVFPKIGLKNCLEKRPVEVKINGHYSNAQEDYAFADYWQNKTSAKWQIGFMSDGVSGLWGLATMSMRGIHSCMSWKGGGSSTHLVGSIADPCVGMVYLTNGKTTEYGLAIKRRSLVRFVLSTTGKRYLSVDRVYAADDPRGNEDPCESSTMRLFVSFLQRKVGRGIEVRATDSMPHRNTYIPEHPALHKLSGSYKSYFDHDISYNRKQDGYKNLHKLGIPIPKKILAKTDKDW